MVKRCRFNNESGFWVDILKTKLSLGILVAAFSLTLSAQAFESAPTSFIVVNSTYSGHEEITRQAINKTLARFNEMGAESFSKITDLTVDLDAAPKGLFGQTSKNMVIHGNFASDFPRYTSVMDLGEFWKIKKFSDFEHPDTQAFHFLRNYIQNTSLASAYTTCMDARAAIRHITREAIVLWNAGDQRKALFLMGHALHTIQDSFSPAHTVRDLDPMGNSDVKNICFYGVKIKERVYDPRGPVCYHSSPDSKDAIWNISQGQQVQTKIAWPDEASIQCDKSGGYPDTDDRKQACLKHEARLARLASEKYLFLVFAHLNMDPERRRPLDNFIESLNSRLFEGPTGNAELDVKMANGIMRCQGLSTDIIAGSEPIIN